MIGEREQVKNNAGPGAGLSFAPTVRTGTPIKQVERETGAPLLAPRIGHRFQEMAVVPELMPDAQALPKEKEDAPREGDTGKTKQAAPTQRSQIAQAPKQKVKAIEYDVTLGVLTFTFEDGPAVQTKPEFDGEPDYGEYVIPVEDGVIPDSAIIPCKRTQDGQALKWTYPPGATLEGVRSIQLTVVGIDQPVKITPLPVKDKENKGGTGKAAKGSKDEVQEETGKGKAEAGQGEGEIAGKGKKDGAPSAVTGTEAKGKPTTQPSSVPSSQPVTAPTAETAAQPTSTPTSQPSATASDDKALYDFLETLSPELRDFLTAEGGAKTTDLDKLKAVVQELQTLTPQELGLLEKAAPARTNDLDLFLKTVQWFKALSPEEKRFVAMTKEEKLVAAKKQSIEASGAALQEAAAHPLKTAYQMTLGQLGLGLESYKNAREDFKKAKSSSGKGRRGFLMGGLSKSLLGVSQATLTLGLLVGGAALLVSGPAVLVGSLVVAGVVGLAGMFAQIDSAMSHLDAAAEAKTLAKFNEHSTAAAEEFASLTLVPLGALVLAGLIKGLKFGLGKLGANKGVPAGKALDATVEASEKVVAEIEKVDAELVKEKKPAPESYTLASDAIPEAIKKIYEKQDKATAAEKKIIADWLAQDAQSKVVELGADYFVLEQFAQKPRPALANFAGQADVSGAVEKALTKDPTKPKPTIESVLFGKDVIEGLESRPENPANKRVLSVIYDIFRTQENPKAYATVLGEVWTRAKHIAEADAARVERTGRSPFTLALVDMLVERGVKIEIVTDGLDPLPFKEQIFEPGAALLDLAFEDLGHRITPHMIQYLVIDNLLKGMESPMTMQEFLKDLAKVTREEKVSATEMQTSDTNKNTFGGEIWNFLFDEGTETMRSPEYLMTILRQIIPELE